MTLPLRFLVPFLLVSSAAHALQNGESPYLFGIHDPGGENHMADKGRKGWIVFTEGIGRNPADYSGRDYRPWSDAGYGVLVRLNHDYGSGGTIPYQKHHDAFAQRVANYVAASPGAHLWIIGNEMNWQVEWPAYEGLEEPITPARYASCFLLCRSRIKALAGHAGDSVMPGAVGTYGLFQNSQDWVSYHLEILAAIGAGNVDAVVIHAYTHGSDPAYVSDESKFQDPRVAHLHWNFRAYRDYLNAHPAWAQSLPVYITETDQNSAWLDPSNGWVQAAYREIHEWNQTAGTQKIRALCLYRWQNKDPWVIDGRWGVINDWRAAMDQDYRWGTPAAPPPAGQPDVTVTSLTYASGIFTCTVSNLGGAATPSGVPIGVGYFVDGVQRAWGTLPGPLAAGAAVTIGTSSGAWYVPAGSHTLLAYADDLNRFAESNEGNNQLSKSVTVGSPGLPDVVVSALSYANGVFSSTVRNQGTAPTPAGVTIGVAYWADGAYRTWGAVTGPLAAGASVTIGTQGGAVALASGSHTIQAVVDDINRFAESNESNNSFIQSITRGGPALPDVVVTSISYSGGLFQCTVRNQGTAATPAGVAVGAAYFVDGVYRTWGSTMGPLAAGAAVVLGTQGGSYVIPAGTHSVRALADDVNRFAESNESNNDLSQSFTIATGAALKTAPVAEDPELVIAPDPEAAPSAGGGGGACGLLGLEALIVLYFAARLRPLRGLREGFVPFF